MFPVVSESHFAPYDPYLVPLILGGHDTFTTALWPCIVLLILSTALLGLFTALALFATLVLVRKGLRHLSTSVLFVVILLMYASAVLHWTTHLLNVIGYYNVARAYGAQLLCQCTSGDLCRFLCLVLLAPKLSCPMIGFGLPGFVHGLTVCAPTAILTINIVLGDAVVWWRVLLVRMTCGVVLLTATLAMGIIDTTDSCSKAAAFSVLSVFNLTDVPLGPFYQLDLFGLAASVLSLATNMVAKILIACKAWEHGKVMSSVSSLKRSSRIEKILIFLIESGTVYCVVWVCVLAHQVALLGSAGPAPPLEQKVLTQFDYFKRGCLIPLIGMYPTVIITLIALNKSHFHGTSFSGGPVSDLSFRHPTSIATIGTSNEEPSLSTITPWPHTPARSTSKIDRDSGSAAALECRVDKSSSDGSGGPPGVG